MSKKTICILSGFILFAALSRLIPHAYNFAPLGAIALFGGAYFKNLKWAFLIPFGAFWMSDLILNNTVYSSFYDGFTWMSGGFLYTYGSMAMIVVLGYYLLKKISFTRVAGGAFGASVIFFIVSNFGVWAGGSIYPMTAEGLIACYTAAIPFFHNTLAGDLIYSGILFGGYEWLRSTYPELQLIHEESL